MAAVAVEVKAEGQVAAEVVLVKAEDLRVVATVEVVMEAMGAVG